MKIAKLLVFVCSLGVFSSLGTPPATGTTISLAGAPHIITKTAQHGIPSAILKWDAPRLFEIEEFEIKRGAYRYNLQGKAPVPFNSLFISGSLLTLMLTCQGFK